CHGTPELQDGFADAFHILIEPVAELEPRMQAILRKRRGEHHMIALSDRAGTQPMRVPQGAWQGATLANPGSGATVRQVPVSTLDALLAGRDLAGPVLLKTD